MEKIVTKLLMNEKIAKAQKEIEKLTAMNVVELDIVAKNIYVEQDDNKEEE